MIPKLFENNHLIHAVFSRPIKKDVEKVVIAPLELKGKKIFQFTTFVQNKALHKNYSQEEAEIVLKELQEKFKEAHFYTVDGDYLALKDKKSGWRLIQSKSTKAPRNLMHNRKKNYLLDAESSAEFWKALGIASSDGKIKPDKQAKFRQVNRFIEIVADVIPNLSAERLCIVDFGCGKAYLTFALYYYLVEKLNRPVEMIGVDLKQDVVDHLEKIRKTLGYDSLKFYTGDIKTFPLPHHKIDLVVSLHACDTATDHVLNRAIKAGAEAILAVPCCQHAFYAKIKQPILNPLLKHGILKERFAALATDAARAAMLEISGYKTQVIEFIDTEHTPKNILIKAVKTEQLPSKELTKDYEAFLAFLFR